MTSVLPLILDPEASIVEKCLSYFQELVIERIIHASKCVSPFRSACTFCCIDLQGSLIIIIIILLIISFFIGSNEDSVWILLNEIDKRAPEITKFLQKICALLGKEKQLPKKLIICLENAITKQKMKVFIYLFLI